MDEITKKRINNLLLGSALNPSDAYFLDAEDSVVTFLDKRANTIARLHTQLTPEGQKQLIALLLTSIASTDSALIGKTAGFAAIHTGAHDDLMVLMTTKWIDIQHSGFEGALESIIEVLDYEPNRFSEAQVDALHDWAQEILVTGTSGLAEELGRGHDPELGRKFRTLRRLTNDLLGEQFATMVEAGFNPELNVDAEKVRTMAQRFGFPVDLTAQLDHIDELVAKADNPQKYRDCLSAIRVFVERLFEVVAKSLDESTKIDGKDSGETIAFFRERKLISGDFGQLLIAWRHYLSNDGAHRLKSRSEDARISKNINLELSLYLLKRLETTVN
jgi:hypothetical protein